MKLTQEEKEQLKRFPKYDGKGKYVGTRDYWESVFQRETNRDPELHTAFSKLHDDIVNMVIRFCQEHNLTDVDCFVHCADGLAGSIEYGEWCPCTDSTIELRKTRASEKVDIPFLFEF